MCLPLNGPSGAHAEYNVMSRHDPHGASVSIPANKKVGRPFTFTRTTLNSSLTESLTGIIGATFVRSFVQAVPFHAVQVVESTSCSTLAVAFVRATNICFFPPS